MHDAEQHVRVIRTQPDTDTVDITMIGRLDRDTAPAFHQQVATAPHGPQVDARDQACEDPMAVYQAQGMVMVQLNGTLAQALVRMRAYAHAHNRRLGDVATDVVARRLRFDPDRP